MPKIRKQLPAQRSRTWPAAGIVALALFLGTAILYAPARQYDFVRYDDDEYVTDNPYVIGGLSRRDVLWAFTKFHAANWHPLTWLSHMADVDLWGAKAGGHHLTNLLLHSLNSALLFLVLRAMTGAVGRSAFVAILLAWHPLHVESVAWVSERKDLLSAFFWIVTLALYARYARRPGVVRYLLVVGSFACGLMSKPMVVTLPLVLLLLDYWPLRRAELARESIRQWRRLVVEKLPLLLLSLVSGLITLAAQSVKSPLNLSWQVRICNALVSYVSYLGKAFWPAKLAVLYPVPLTTPIWQGAVAGALLVLISLTVFGLTKRYPYAGVGWAWYLITLLPVIGLIETGYQAMADRYTYLPFIGIGMAAAWGTWDLLAKTGAGKVFAAALFAAAALPLWPLTRNQLPYWRDSSALFRRALAVTSGNWIAQNNLSSALLAEGDPEEAALHASEAIRIRPDYSPAYLNLGVARLRQGNPSEAISQLRKAIEIAPSLGQAHFNLGAALMATGRMDEAIQEGYATLRLTPDYLPALKALAWVLSTHPAAEQRNGADALRFARRAAELTAHGDPQVLDILAAALAEAGQFEEATQVATHARDLSRAAGQDQLAKMIQSRLEMYQLGLPYRASLR